MCFDNKGDSGNSFPEHTKIMRKFNEVISKTSLNDFLLRKIKFDSVKTMTGVRKTISSYQLFSYCKK